MAELSITYTLTAPDNSAVSFTKSGPYILETITGLDSADRRTASEPRPAADGTIVYPTRRGSRTITLEGFIVGTDASDLNSKEEALMMVLDQLDNADAILSWTPSGASGARQCALRLIDPSPAIEPAQGMPLVRTFVITLLCYDGQILGSASTTHSYSSSDTVNIASDGSTARQYPILRLHGPLTAASVGIKDTAGNIARQVSLSGFDLASGDYVEIDTLLETLRLNGDASKPRTSWMDLVTSNMPWMMATSTHNTFVFSLTGSGSLDIITTPAYASAG